MHVRCYACKHIIYIMHYMVRFSMHQWWLVQCWYFHNRPIPIKVWLQAVFSFVDLKSGTDVVAEAEAMSLEVMSKFMGTRRYESKSSDKAPPLQIYLMVHDRKTEIYDILCVILLDLLVYKSCCICMCHIVRIIYFIIIYAMSPIIFWPYQDTPEGWTRS